MKAAIKAVMSRLVGNDAVWGVLRRSIVPMAHYAESERRRQQRARRLQLADAALAAVIPDLVVRHGPFRGLRYPRGLSNDGTLFSKLLGTYEQELQPLVESLAVNPYTDVIDIGCAEGYYAVGLALRIPTARVHAFDIDELALSACRAMADLNQVGDRIETKNHVDPATLLAFKPSGRALVVCDCEGYERTLFSPQVVSHLAGHDLIIELHDFIHPNLSPELRARFAQTHDITVVRSIDDEEKARTYACEELSGYDVKTRQLLIGEVRPVTMEWFCLTAKYPAGLR